MIFLPILRLGKLLNTTVYYFSDHCLNKTHKSEDLEDSHQCCNQVRVIVVQLKQF